MVNVLIFLLIFGVIVCAHEFGHFIMAKKNGVAVIEFSIGMGPKICSVVKNGTRYSLKWIPFGGSCQLLGNDEGLPDEEIESEIQDPDEHAYNNKPIWVRISITAAGPIFNFILAFLLAIVLNAVGGVDLPVLSGVMEGYPAETSGLQAGDKITKIDGQRMMLHRDVSLYLQFHQTQAMTVTYERDGTEQETILTPQWSEKDQRYYIGIISQGYVKLDPWQTIRYALTEVRYNTTLVFKSLGMLFTGQAGINDLSGPVGIVNMVGTVVEQSAPGGILLVVLNLLSFTIFISANLGIMNLLPIPGLDGGRLLFHLIEAVRGKPVNPKYEGMVNVVGFILLMLLMVVVMFNDIRKLFI